MNEVLAQKVTSLQRCVSRAREARAEAGANFRTSYNLQAAAVLNVIRACDTAIDLANMLNRRRRLGFPLTDLSVDTSTNVSTPASMAACAAFQVPMTGASVVSRRKTPRGRNPGARRPEQTVNRHFQRPRALPTGSV